MADIKNITIDGTTYDLKDAKARDDTTALKEDIEEQIQNNGKYLGYDSINSITSISQGYYTNNGTVNTNNQYTYSNAIDVSNAGFVYIDGTLMTAEPGQPPAVGVFLDNNDTLIATLYDLVVPSSPPWFVPVPNGATKLYINTSYRKSDYPNSVPSGLVCFKVEKEIAFLSDITGGKHIKILAGVIRNTGDGWYFIHNDTHDDLNFSSITVNESGRIVLSYGFTAKKVLSLVVSPDETFSRLYSIGASVGVSDATLRIYSVPKFIGGAVQYNGSIWQTNYANFSSYSFNTSTGALVMNHESVENYPTSSRQMASATGRRCNVQLGTLDNDSMTMYFLDENGNVKTTPDDNMRAYVTRNLPSVEVNANNVTASDGNFWVFGVMEV